MFSKKIFTAFRMKQERLVTNSWLNSQRNKRTRYKVMIAGIKKSNKSKAIFGIIQENVLKLRVLPQRISEKMDCCNHLKICFYITILNYFPSHILSIDLKSLPCERYPLLFSLIFRYSSWIFNDSENDLGEVMPMLNLVCF